jgi:iron complex transport system substrate-binding protein
MKVRKVVLTFVAVAVVLGAFIGAATPPQRVVVAGIPLYSEILISLGLLDRIVGVADSPENPPEVAGLPRVGPVWHPSLEAIVALSPDLVLGPPPLLRDQLESLGVATFSGGGEDMWITDILEVLATIEQVGQLMGVAREAQILTGEIAKAILALEAKVLGRERPSAAVLYLYDPAGAPYVAGRGTPEDEVISRGGGVNAFRDLDGYVQVGVETILARDPAVLFVGTGQRDNLVRHVTLSVLTAVREGRVFEIAASHLVSTRVAEVLEAVARALHPAAFAEGK